MNITALAEEILEACQNGASESDLIAMLSPLAADLTRMTENERLQMERAIRAEAQLAEAERDAARYRFIRNCCEVTCLGIEIESDAHIDKYLEAWPHEPTVSAEASRG